MISEVRRQAEAEKEVAIAETKKKKWVWSKERVASENGF